MLKKKTKESHSSKKSKDSSKKIKNESSEKEIKKKKEKDSKKHKAETNTTCDKFDLMVDVSEKLDDQKDRFVTGEYESVIPEVDKKPKKRSDGDKKDKKENDGKTKSRSKKVKSGKSEEESESGKRKKSSKKGRHNFILYFCFYIFTIKRLNLIKSFVFR